MVNAHLSVQLKGTLKWLGIFRYMKKGATLTKPKVKASKNNLPFRMLHEISKVAIRQHGHGEPLQPVLGVDGDHVHVDPVPQDNVESCSNRVSTTMKTHGHRVCGT